jgi:adenine-specific DNA-methyltransferase
MRIVNLVHWWMGKADRGSHLTIGKIFKTVRSRCEWSHDNDSLKIQNGPKAPLPPGSKG